jgi:broad specificity phosphatase PhoE
MRSDFRLCGVDHSGATVPELHRLLHFASKASLTLCLGIISVKRAGYKQTQFLCHAAHGESNSVTTRLTLISHAATQAQRRAAFPLDEPLEQQEISKIIALGWKAPKVQKVLSAPERRTQQTAQALGLTATATPELRDCDYGVWRGLELSDIQTKDPEAVATWLADPAASPHKGESIANLIDRVARWLDQQRVDDHTIAVTHPAVIRSAVVHLLNAPVQSFWRIDIAPLSLTDLRFNGKVWTLRSCATTLLP